MSFSVYWAGGLFDFKELCGNAAAAEAVRKISGGGYDPVLPQNSESNAARSVDIRDHDLEMVFHSDLIAANFDGTDLDSGTVVEFICAKMLDLPAVLLRTDFRVCGDQKTGGDPWNLMCSGYPRTESLHIHSILLYHELGRDASKLTEETARRTVAALDRARNVRSRFGGSTEKAVDAYRIAADACGPSFRKLMTDSVIAEIVARRREKGLL